VNTSTTTLSAIGAPGERVALHTHLVVREDDLVLYGFATWEELTIFEMLIGVSGVGPRAAIAMLSAFRSDELAGAIARNDVIRLTAVPGIGRRTAERIALELKDKLQDYLAVAATASSDRDDVVTALTALGYSRAEATEAAGKVELDDDAPVEERLRAALAHFSTQ
jgi:Holliday junction DNA helicase RuvA